MSKNMFAKKIQLSFVVGLSAVFLMACHSNSATSSNTNAETTAATTETSTTATADNVNQKEFDQLVARGDIQLSGFSMNGTLAYNDDTLKLVKGERLYLTNGDELTFAFADQYIAKARNEGKTLSVDDKFTYKITTLKEIGKINNIDKLYQTLKERVEQANTEENVKFEVVYDNRMRIVASSKDAEQLDAIEPAIIVKQTRTDRVNKEQTSYLMLTFSIKVDKQDLSNLIDDTVLSTAKTIDPSSENNPVRENRVAFLITEYKNYSDESVKNMLKTSPFRPYHE